MKTYTDIEQSNMLAEILPLESADMSYRPYREIGGIPDYQATLRPYKSAGWAIPCWSLAALLDIIPMVCLDNFFDDTTKSKKWNCLFTETHHPLEAAYYDNPVDACVDMIVRLKKYNLI